MLLYYFPHDPGHYVLVFETFVANNLRYGCCAHVQVDIRRFLFCVILKIHGMQLNYFIQFRCMLKDIILV